MSLSCCLDFVSLLCVFTVDKLVFLFLQCFEFLCCECRSSFGAVGLGLGRSGWVGLGRVHNIISKVPVFSIFQMHKFMKNLKMSAICKIVWPFDSVS